MDLLKLMDLNESFAVFCYFMNEAEFDINHPMFRNTLMKALDYAFGKLTSLRHKVEKGEKVSDSEELVLRELMRALKDASEFELEDRDTE